MIAAKHVYGPYGGRFPLPGRSFDEPLRQQRGRSKPCKVRSESGDSGCLSCSWVGFPPAPRFQLLSSTALTVSTTSYHFVPHLSCKSFIVKKKLNGGSPTPAPIQENTKACG